MRLNKLVFFMEKHRFFINKGIWLKIFELYVKINKNQCAFMPYLIMN